MKTRYMFSALGLMLMMAACQKEEQSEPQGGFAPPPSDRCGCLAPAESEARNATDVSIDLIWNAMPEAVAYRVEVASKFNAADDVAPYFLEEITEDAQLTVSHLAPNTRYEYRITTICGNDESNPTPIMTFVTADFHHGDPGYIPTQVQNTRNTNAQ